MYKDKLYIKYYAKDKYIKFYNVYVKIKLSSHVYMDAFVNTIIFLIRVIINELIYCKRCDVRTLCTKINNSLVKTDS
jgi:hypothetical protein